ncbi:hypothetical protein [Nocardioides marmorisolisilvae]|uniref:Uncharacterized protein n=1 Tax=Nocardioides marmorisolisilvae TaxID=1542737 RepID=A0A3N0DWS9_9ACTN|nr:hypothetical protein [Nocardioides marmorisolisilvae]RNL80068.1 hypothetical protein EFL95_14235 [Nocardioides marmorisolisilvae]
MTSRTISRAAVALAAAISFTVGTAAMSQADSFRHQDATGDVVVTTTGSPGDTHVDPDLALPDFQKLTVQHSRWNVRVATVLRSVDGYGSTWTATIVTSQGERFQVTYGRSEAGPQALVHVSLVHNGYHSTCDGLHVSRTTPTATSKGVIADVPTRCLGNPWKVRVGVQAHTVYSDDAVEHRGHDDVLRTGAFTYYKPALSPWIAR